ncbi:MAG: TonB-dependent receptor plug domain-containing protein [Gemmatimonadota bacterium]
MLTGEARGQILHGVVLYASDDAPVALAAVRLLDGDGVVVAAELTRPDGRFQIFVPTDGAFSVHVEHPAAFATVDGPLALSTLHNTFVTFHVQARPIELEGLEVTAERRSVRLEAVGYYERARDGLGFFVGPERLQARPPVRSSDVFRGVPGVQLLGSGTAGVPSFPLMSFALRGRFWTEGPGGGTPPCFPRVYVDGQVVEIGGSGNVPAQSFDQLVPAQDVAAVEVYRSPAEMPAQFGGLTQCGVILVWTTAHRR